MSYPDLTQFKALSFDCFGTLIDQESGFIAGLESILSRLPSSSNYKNNPIELVRRLNALAWDLEVSEPELRYDLILSQSFERLAGELDVSVSEDELDDVRSWVGRWVPFPDSVPGLEILKKHFKLIILSNVDNANISRTLDHFRPSVEFDKVYTAQDIGSYKPSHRNFNYLFTHVKDELNVDREKGELLHVARSLTADHVPAKQIGQRSVWISRGGETRQGQGVGGDYEKLKGDVAFEWRFDSIGKFAEEVERQFREKGV
ncbi:Haloacid dehalogenase, type II [Fusarium keratoplasticum]|uniref:Haloacid dehalogenase, type II n=1 Tax=Fusarium keratoplasticum TaxID=1328300 RepID=A0ACC0QBG9_9HYPO|nr:Haloacid dehalogenase, type II [Fusarium keratoplasticum]KAI8649079.1 Haloacid dehalogenase, type II [Fusarium keratoplasticum]KAI8649482.1 Haloacid dehalogenase, type II [Fusarium keratoplasticum]